MSAEPAHALSPAAVETVGIIGLGYVGLPLAMALAKSGLRRVVGFDIDPARVAEIAAGGDRTREVDPPVLAAANAAGIFAPTADEQALTDLDVYILTVPTPVDSDKRPDFRPLEGACRTVGSILKRRSATAAPPIVVVESTVYPGVTEDICGPAIEEASGRRAGIDFFLGYSPERINPGDRTHTVDRIMKVVAGQTPEVAERLKLLYGRATTGGIFIARNIRTAEAAKVIENAQRDLNVAFVNEVTMIFGRLGISIYDVLETARTKWNFLDFRPGLVGGHCIGVDPFYLASAAQAAGHEPEIILAGRRINDGMGDYFAGRIAEQCVARQPRTLVLGLTFKENLPDLRNSKVVDLVQGLRARGHAVDIHDPHADPAQVQANFKLTLLPRLPSADDLDAYDCLVGAVPHDAYRGFTPAHFAALVKPGGLVADIKGMWRSVVLPDSFRRWQP